jgi:putative FmdB family regulatory protein
MPLYEYECDACGHRFEAIQRFSDPLIEGCPKCGGTVHKLQSAPAIQFKGTGWYITDYARKDKDKDADAKSGEKPGEKSGDKPGEKPAEKSGEKRTESSGESKAEGKSESKAQAAPSPTSSPAAPAGGKSSTAKTS